MSDAGGVHPPEQSDSCLFARVCPGPQTPARAAAPPAAGRFPSGAGG